MSETKFDWQEVVERKPRGYLELNDGKKAVHGPIESVEINDDDIVVIKLKWSAEISLGEHGIPEGNWIAIENQPIVFPSLIAPFVIENTPEKGERVRFNNTNILYFNKIDGLDPSKVEGLKV